MPNKNKIKNVFLENARESAGLTRHQASELLGLNYNYFVTIESEYNQPSVKLLRAMSDVYGIPFLTMLQHCKPEVAHQYIEAVGDNKAPTDIRNIPCIGEAGAIPDGNKIVMSGMEKLVFPLKFLIEDTEYYCVVVKDDTLEQDGLHIGDRVIFYRDAIDKIRSGELVAVSHFNDGLFIRRITRSNKGHIFLTCANPAIEIIPWDRSYQIIGGAWMLMRPYMHPA